MKTTISKNTIISVAEDQISGDLLDGEVVILNMNDDVYYGLDQIGGRIWNLVQNPIALGKIIQILLEEFDVEYQQCFDDVIVLLEDMLSKGLIEARDAETK
jgi:hypothetical protein